jgi:hypothetical protein
LAVVGVRCNNRVAQVAAEAVMKAVALLTVSVLSGVGVTDAWAQMQADAPPHWSFELRGGRFAPEVPAWKLYYDDDNFSEFALAIGRKLTRQIEVGGEIRHGSDRGVGDLPLNESRGGDVLYEAYPLQAYVLLRAVLSENQWFVPYVGVGLGRVYYRQSVKNGDKREGDTQAYSWRAGIQCLLDGLSPSSATNLRRGYGIDHTYLVIDYQSTRAEVDSTNWDIGGKTVSVGLLFEY